MVEIHRSGFKKLRCGATERRGLASDAGQANMKERTFFTGWFELGKWCQLGINQAVNVVDCLLCHAPEFWCEYHLAATFAFGMEHCPARNRDIEHFLKAERLGTELGVVILELASFAFFIFHREEGAVGVPFDYVTLA